MVWEHPFEQLLPTVAQNHQMWNLSLPMQLPFETWSHPIKEIQTGTVNVKYVHLKTFETMFNIELPNLCLHPTTNANHNSYTLNTFNYKFLQLVQCNWEYGWRSICDNTKQLHLYNTKSVPQTLLLLWLPSFTAVVMSGKGSNSEKESSCLNIKSVMLQKHSLCFNRLDWSCVIQAYINSIKNLQVCLWLISVNKITWFTHPVVQSSCC